MGKEHFVLKCQNISFCELYVAADSVKSTLSKKLTEPGMQKLVKILSRNSIGLQYVYEMEGNEMTVVFTPSELSTQQNQ